MYTVDEHTLLAIRNLEQLRTSPYRSLEGLKDIAVGTPRMDTLYLAILFHDIGKAAGRRHEEEGYKRLKNIMERFYLEGRKRTRIEFLVKNHVLMSRIAITREISDPKVIAGFADAVGDIDNLKALYLVTYADMSAVNPRFWTAWRAYLLRELYLNTVDYLSGVRDARSRYGRELILACPAPERKAFDSFLQEMPERYFLSTPPEKVREEFCLVQDAVKSGFSLRVDVSPEGFADIVLCTADYPGLFSRIVGYLSSRRLNIVHGRIFTGKTGMVIDKISISNWKEIWWDGLEGDIAVGLKEVVLNRKAVTVTSQRGDFHDLFDGFIELDNETSDDFTLVEIFSRDRIGLLYDVSRVMHEKGVNIVSARINTEAGLAQDVFSVQSENRKVNGAAALELLGALWATLGN
jgi:[protein-PII] uridylyltransferase